MKTVTNQARQPITLTDGTVLAAAGTKGATKDVASLDGRDERLVRSGTIVVADRKLEVAPPLAQAQSPKPKTHSSDAATAKPQGTAGTDQVKES